MPELPSNSTRDLMRHVERASASVRAMPARRQTFDVEMHNDATGETWSVRVDAYNPAGALARVLRRKLWAEALLSEQPHRFVVRDCVAPEIWVGEVRSDLRAGTTLVPTTTGNPDDAVKWTR